MSTFETPYTQLPTPTHATETVAFQAEPTGQPETLWQEHPTTTILIIGALGLASAGLAGVNVAGGAKKLYEGAKQLLSDGAHQDQHSEQSEN